MSKKQDKQDEQDERDAQEAQDEKMTEAQAIGKRKMEPPEADPNRGSAAFEIYSLHDKGRAYDGGPIRGWAETTQEVRDHWNAVHDYYASKK